MVKILKEHKISVENQVKNRERMLDKMIKNINIQSYIN